MLGRKDRGTKRQHRLARALLVGAAGMFAPVLAHAHFVLITPDAWMSQTALGLPEKLGPCGDEGGGTPTGKVTAFRPGQTITVTIDEVVTHPGHYRVALAINQRSELPPEPEVTPTTDDPCASAAIRSPPIFPILADNVLPHTQPFGAPQTFTVTLPTDITCTKCTLQVVEFMSNHSVPCFYHHCADISIQGAVETPTPTPSPTGTNTQTPIPTSTPTPTPTATPLPSCMGDCDGSGDATVDDLITLVTIALGNRPLSACLVGDTDHSGDITVDEIIQAVRVALTSCPGA